MKDMSEKRVAVNEANSDPKTIGTPAKAFPLSGLLPTLEHQMEKSFFQVPVLPLTEESRYVLFSDCHRGNGTWGDNFLKNQHLYFAALQHYFDKKYTYLELGDGDELWENRSMKQIIEIHSNAFWMLSRFYQENRLYLLYGNHDIEKSKTRCSSCFDRWFCTEHQCEMPLLPGIRFYSGIILRDQKTGMELYLTHGHQADFLNSTLWPLARFLVRYLWKPAEQLGILDPTSAAKNNTRKTHTEQRLCRWAKEHHRILITGHTHRPTLASREVPCFNTGSCVHPRCITCIELKNRCLTLVKWSMLTRPDGTLYVGREILGTPVQIDTLL